MNSIACAAPTTIAAAGPCCRPPHMKALTVRINARSTSIRHDIESDDVDATFPDLPRPDDVDDGARQRLIFLHGIDAMAYAIACHDASTGVPRAHYMSRVSRS